MRFDAERKMLVCDGAELRLTRAEALLVATLSRRPGVPFSRGVLMEVLEIDHDYDRSVDAHVKRLRRKMRAAFGQAPIETRYDLGYAWAAGAEGGA